jgi:hypothetical protein
MRNKFQRILFPLGNIDPYCEATIGSQEQRSSVVSGIAKLLV